MAMRPKRNSRDADPPLLDAAGRAQAKRWLNNWKCVAPILERERWDRVRGLSDEDSARDALRLFDLWCAEWPTDEGEELLLHQRVFARGRRD